MLVALDGSGDYTNLQEAIDSIPENNSERVVINIKSGVYKQKVKITKPFVTLIGEDLEKTVLTFDDAATKLLPNDEKIGTFGSYSVGVYGNDFEAQNITFENSAGSGSIVGQAVAVYVDGDRAVFKNCRFLAHQDTLYTGRPFEGSSEREFSRQYYENCFIRGDVDFIFGSGTAVFNKCEIYSNDRKEKINGFVTAAATPEVIEYGYVFVDCKLTSDAEPHTVYLGRPWRDFAKTAFINCYMGEHIIPEGWHNWNKTHAEKLVSYVEYNSFGPGSNNDKREKWTKILNKVEADHYIIEKVLKGSDNWNPIIDGK